MKNSIIERQIGVLRCMLSNIAEKDLNGNIDFIKFTKEYFGFDNNFGWNILMNAFYVFEDTELAKQHYEEFGLQGPSRYRDIGEKYLRLYGILNSIYQQFLTIKNLMELFKLEPRAELINNLGKSKCIELRNKIASHPSNYLTDPNNKKFDVYEISRSDLEEEKVLLLKNQEDFEKYDLNELIIDFNLKAQEILSEILKKFLKKKFNNQGKHFHEFQKIESLRNGSVEIGNQIIEFK